MKAEPLIHQTSGDLSTAREKIKGNTACQPEERKEERKTLPAVEPDRRVPERFSVKGKVGYKILGSQKYSCLKTRPWWALRPGFLGTHHEES